MREQYGKAVGECLKREKRSLVAIADFPKGFTEKALKNLAVLLRDGSKYGINFLIAQNDKMMGTMKESKEFEGLLRRMFQAMRILTSDGGRICYHDEYGGQKYIWHHTMDAEAVLNHGAEIIHEIRRCLL